MFFPRPELNHEALIPIQQLKGSVEDVVRGTERKTKQLEVAHQ